MRFQSFLKEMKKQRRKTEKRKKRKGDELSNPARKKIRLPSSPQSSLSPSSPQSSVSPSSLPSSLSPLSHPSSLSLPSVPSSSSHNCAHDVFPSFRGEDVRVGFLSHIQKEFKRKGIKPFIDNNINRGESIGPELKRAIRGSKIAIILLSKNYAFSKWCLDELVEIMKCKEELGQTVIPVFYKVDPSDVKKLRGYFGKVFEKTCEGKSKQDTDKWRHALVKVATVAGYDSSTWNNEAAMIEEIATDVSNKLISSVPSSDFDSLVGMRAHMESMELLLRLDSDEVRMIGIWGPSGIGKSTIARFLFSQHSGDFQLSVYMENIKREYPRPCFDRYSAQLQLQNKFLSLILNQKDITIHHLGVAQDRLKDKKVLCQTVHHLHSYLRSRAGAGACLVLSPSSPRPPPRRLVCIATVSDRSSNPNNVLMWRGRVVSHNRLSVAAAKASSSSAPQAAGSSMGGETLEKDVYKALSQIIDPDFGTDIVSCGFVKDLVIDQALGEVSFRLELTTPACPVKDMFEKQANEVVAVLPWVKKVNVTMSAQPAKPIFAGQLPPGLSRISSIVAVSSCKGGVGKSTVAVNLAYTLAGMGARVGIFDADVYGPSLPTMVNPESRILEMDPEKKSIIPTEYLGVKLVSFGFAGQGRAIMRGPMVSGVINQLLTTTEWGELDYLVIDMPPGTGDIQLTLCQIAPLTAAVIVTTPQKLAFIDVAKGVRMFSKLKVPCVAVVENMCHFDADGKRYYPFGKGSGSQVVQQFGIPHLFDLPIRPTLSASGDSGVPEVVSDPLSEVARTFQDLGVCVVQQCAKIRQQVSTAVTYDKYLKAIRVKVPNSDEEFLLHPATVRRNDRSAQSVDEWTGEQKIQFGDVAEDIEPEEIRPMGNYAVSITWPDGFSQIAPYDQLETIERLVEVPPLSAVEV